MPEPKLYRLLGQVNATIKPDAVVQEELVGLNGRILHYVLLVPSSRFNLNYIIKPEVEEEDFGDGSWKTALVLVVAAEDYGRPSSHSLAV
jgi:hypothetical protein